MILSIGDPAVEVRGIPDTGSTMVWFPQHQYNQSKSKSFEQLWCNNDMCNYVPHSSENCRDSSSQCRFSIGYGGYGRAYGPVGWELFTFGEPLEEPSGLLVGIDESNHSDSNTRSVVIGLMDHPVSLISAVGVHSFSICYPVAISRRTHLRLGDDAILRGPRISLLPYDNPEVPRMEISIAAILFFDLNIQGFPCMIDTGVTLTHFNATIYDLIAQGVRRMMEGSQEVRGPREICYSADEVYNRTAYMTLMLRVDGCKDGYEDVCVPFSLSFDNMWSSPEDLGIPNMCCFAFLRGKRNILGMKQMRGKNIGIDLSAKMFSFENDECEEEGG